MYVIQYSTKEVKYNVFQMEATLANSKFIYLLYIRKSGAKHIKLNHGNTLLLWICTYIIPSQESHVHRDLLSGTQTIISSIAKW